MATNPSFDGVRFSIKVDRQTLAHLTKEADGSAREAVARAWLVNWRTLANLSPFLYQRLVYSARTRRLPLVALVNEALTKYCAELPPVPAGTTIATPLDVLPEGTQEPEDSDSDTTPTPSTPTARRAKASRKH